MRIFVLDRLAQCSNRCVGRQHGGGDPERFQTCGLAHDRLALDAESLPTYIVNYAKGAPHFGQTEIRVVLAQRQTIFGPTGKHAIRLGDTAGHQIVDQNAEIGLVTTRAPDILAAGLTGGINSGQQALRSGFFITRGAIYLARKKQTIDGACFKRILEPARIVVVVLDGVTGTQDVAVFHAANRAHDRQLNIEGQGCRYSVRIDLVRIEAFGLEKHMVA